jgi:hypothetical protein
LETEQRLASFDRESTYPRAKRDWYFGMGAGAHVDETAQLHWLEKESSWIDVRSGTWETVGEAHHCGVHELDARSCRLSYLLTKR